ncbi:O-acetylhomoserine aminocarboxypropyltransferase/cysteine synthase family protein [Halorubrum ezzemoulense]|uniref:O-acetylhomoserine aminocarboxypropyltransferase/cysteine synthase family protein n=1 Tax=Halorubrum ezzemoulense TaxID=337243 RepID=UPI0023308E18|nr:O-acetylhomoserine aminocarboxypropyltransferase/cysteine synthase family protein [Halorubrum ezzemoulense]MDB2225961.1 O-acetylhomoserine aminocarboxypropyltransferase/cysteine synthase [Halorubrum ezzemoulense]MDB2238615.1 O-acetylhomoserine aminocarboxypropyltransferase/cysteine synthase [Halorubrum ezzemoulense]MDB2247923.1 O-acetylhomoserine aminocarboxypropyltransferase/cysteine synthase [Halorubrum ezzemoulense]MDB2265318.1 O-acetylhomoserine aminocarboxypropyltransferase/cysteine syn
MPSDEGDDGPKFSTRSVHAGSDPDPATGARATPIYQTTAYQFDDADHAADLFGLEEAGNVYSRLMNPTNAALEERIASLEGGVGAVATASGMASLDVTTFLLASAGDNIVTSSALYGGTYTYLTHSVERRGVSTRFVDPLDYEGYAEAIDGDTAYVHLETIGNPALVTPDIQRIADIAHDHGVPLFVDNTFATPYLCRPLEHGADLVWESTTKWLTGNGTTVGGVVVDGGSFPWADHAEKYPEIAQDNPAYHGINFAERFGDAAFTFAAITRGLRDLGDQQSPFDAWNTLQQTESLPLRMDRHCENAGIVAEYLDDHDDVAWVNYPGLESHETHEEASEYLEGGYGGMLTFGLEAGYEAARATVEEADLASLVANVGDAKTLVIHPASTTHQQLTEAEQEAAGVTPDMVRLSVGIEDPADIVADLEAAIEAATE